MILYSSKTKFNDITVTRKGTVITLWSPSDIKQSAVNLNTPHLPGLEYARNTLLALSFHPDPSSILVIGLGGGTIPLMYHAVCKNARIYVIEIDPEMLLVARRFFNFKENEKISVIHDDAFSFCSKTEKRFDIVIMDAYIGEYQPEGLTSVDFFGIVRGILTENGVLANNLMKGRGHQFENKCRSMKSVFRFIRQLPGETRDNIIIFASQKKTLKFEIIKNAVAVEKTLPFPFPIARLAGHIVPAPGS
jgi:spermidine synthase